MHARIRLPSHIRPERYRVTLAPNLKRYTFAGEETITIRIEKPVREITLHAKDLKITSAVITFGKAARGEGVEAAAILYNKESETVTFRFADVIPKGKAELRVAFRGVLNDSLHGFYRSRYEANGKPRVMATTQFEPTDARRAFPCFDEPAMKAIFEVTLIAPRGTTAISNTPAVSKRAPPRRKGMPAGTAYRFAPTPKMSTYLLSFIVGEFEYIERATKEGVTVRVYTTPGKKSQAEFALDVAVRTISFFNRYFGIPYPLPMLQLIAIPDFGSGAMENWGAVTYRESALLVDPNTSSAANKQQVAIVIAHELAHQWFGNLVTMQWWTDLWLNEGFASYIEYLAVNDLFPEWDIWTHFVAWDLSQAFRLDALANTHPIEIEVHHPNEINEIFDAVSYSKGASVIRMLAAYLGEDVFRRGLHTYLRRHKYGNAVTADLWQALEDVSKKSVRNMMNMWTKKPGYPLVTIEEKKNALILTQKRFFSSPLAAKSSRDTTVWQIPLGVEKMRSEEKERAKERASEPELISRRNITLRGVPLDAKLNIGETGLFRVLYPAPRRILLAARVENKSLPAADRLGLIRDAFALAENGALRTDEALAFLESYKNEHDFSVWSECMASMGSLANLLSGTSSEEPYRNFARAIVAEIARKVTWSKHPNEPHTMTLLRGMALGAYGSYGDRDTVRVARERFEEYRVRHKEIDPDIRGMVYGLVARYGTAADHAMFIKLYKTTANSQEKDRIAGALALFRDQALLEKTLTFAFSPSVRRQDAPFVARGVGANPEGRELMWKFLKDNWKTILARYGGGGHMLYYFVQPLGRLVRRADAEEIEKFFRAHKAPGAERAVRQAVERIRSNAAWLARDLGRIEKYLEHYKIGAL